MYPSARRGSNDGIQASIARRLATLSSLRTLRAHLELPESAIATLPPRSTMQEFVRHYIPDNTDALCETAAALGSLLPQSGLALWLLRRENGGARWGLFRQVVEGGIDECSRAELDPDGGPASMVVLPPWIRMLTCILGNPSACLWVVTSGQRYEALTEQKEDSSVDWQRPIYQSQPPPYLHFLLMLLPPLPNDSA